MRTNTSQSVWWRFLRSPAEARRKCDLPLLTISRTVRLERDQPVRLEKPCGVKRIQVQRGRVWLTGTPATGDILLGPGDTFGLNGAWPFVLQPLLNADAELLLIY